MADWRLYPVDRAVNRITLNTQVSATLNNALSPRLVDGRNRTQWLSGGTTINTALNLSIASSSYNIGAIAFGNAQNMASEPITIYRGNSLGSETTSIVSITAPDLEDWLYTFSSAPTGSAFYRVKFTTTISAALSIGTVSLLDDDYMIEFSADDDYAPEFPIGQPVSPGFVPLPMAGGGYIRHIQHGAQNKWRLSFPVLSTGSGSTHEAIRSSLRLNNGWANGVWLTTDEYNSTSDRRAYYCLPAPGQDIERGLSIAGPYAYMQIELHEMVKGAL